jgi:hypothetical protein
MRAGRATGGLLAPVEFPHFFATLPISHAFEPTIRGLLEAHSSGLLGDRTCAFRVDNQTLRLLDDRTLLAHRDDGERRIARY